MSRAPRSRATPPATHPAPHLPADASRLHLFVVLALGVIVVAAHVAGATFATDALWGSHAYAFLPRWVLPAALVLMAAAIVIGLVRLRDAPASPAVTRLGAARLSGRAWATRAGIAFAAWVVLWAARSREILLGDGIPLTANLPTETALHLREPLTSLVHQQVYRLAHAASAGRDVHAVARDAVASGSVAAGVLFVFVSFAIGAELLRLRPAPFGEARAPGLAKWIGLLLCAQGFVQLFFGYVENYAYEALAVGIYLWLALRWLRGAAPLIAPLAAWFTAIAFNLSMVTLGVSAALLVGLGLAARGRRLRTLRDVALGAALFAVVAYALYAWGGHYRLDAQMLAMFRKGEAHAAYLFSAAHLRDFTAEQLLIGPLALLWLLPALVVALPRRTLARPAAAFLALTGLVQALVCWMVADLPLGYARDWDLFAPFGIVLAVAAAGLVMTRMGPPRAVQRLLVVALAVSLFHTAPWIALNASADRSLERFKHLPLGQGRTESTVGFWYFAEGRLDEARVWLERSLAADSNNVRAYAHLGNIALIQGDYALAARHFERAVRLRPNQPLFRQSLVMALIGENRPVEALHVLAVLVEQEPKNARHWAVAAVLLRGVGRIPEAHEAMRHAMELAPGDSLFTAAAKRLGTADGYAALLDDEWPKILARQASP